MRRSLAPTPRHPVVAFLTRALPAIALAGCASAPAPTAPTTAPTPVPVGSTAATPTASPMPAANPAPAPAPSPAQAPDETTRAGFARWVTEFRTTARAAGINEATLSSALNNVQFLPQVIELDRAQPELLRTVWDYLDRAVTPQRVAQGQDKLRQVRAPADAAAAQYGVPPSILVAIWGVESNYGGNYGNIPTVDALATLGFEGRREEWARGQLVTALKILQNGDIDRSHMIGSWAGAMGQTQFLPSIFMAYAVDGDGDGRRDIWGSMADVLPSTANFIASEGWQRGQLWGAEVQLPPNFDHGRADPELRQTSAQWAAEGVRSLNGAALPQFNDGAILLPAGARGPAFLVGPNFRAILRYNNSNSYALAVGLLSQRIDGGPPVRASWPRDLPALTRSQLVALQNALNQRGFDSGPPDGMMGPVTAAGLRRYQRSIQVPADGYPTPDVLQRLQVR